MSEVEIQKPFNPFLYQCPVCAGLKFEVKVTNGDGSQRIAIFTCMKGHDSIWKWVPQEVVEA